MAVDPRSLALAPLGEALTRAGDRWSLLLVAALEGGARRFNDLLEDLSGVAPNVLTTRLRTLEREALVVARPYSQRPPRFVYELTDAGRQLAEALRPLAEWGAQHAEGVDPPRHGLCGTPLEVRWWCPTCELAVAEDDAEDVELA